MFSRRRMPPENCWTGSAAAIGEPGTFERPVHLLIERRAARALAGGRTLEILPRGQQRVERDLLGNDAELRWGSPAVDHAIEHADLTCVEAHATGDRANERRLPGAVRTEQREQLALPELERRPVERLDGAERFRALTPTECSWRLRPSLSEAFCGNDVCARSGRRRFAFDAVGPLDPAAALLVEQPASSADACSTELR